MTKEELGAELGISPNYIYKHWRTIVERYALYGIDLYRRGRADKVDYGIQGWTDDEVRWEPKKADM